ncbi:MAG: hypothetical protein M0P71_12095 [Melioribacteraceae bacterium]|jgi:hypothetical protein|nr:hypothetical protein [Melioribacteraceae bacterium]
MPKELFNQILKTTLDAADRIAIGIPSQVGANNITTTNLLKQTGNWNIVVETITNADLTAGVWAYNHAKNTTVIRGTLRNPAGYEQALAGMLHVVDAYNIEIEFGGAIEAGDWTFIFEYILI